MEDSFLPKIVDYAIKYLRFAIGHDRNVQSAKILGFRIGAEDKIPSANG